MIATLLTLLALSTSASAAPASCMGKTGQAQVVCQEQRAAHQASQLAALQRELDALEKTCSQVCDSAPAAPRTSSGPSRTYLVLDAYGKRIDELERKTATPPLATPPVYVPGPAGEDGRDGRDGTDGKDAPVVADLLVGVGGLNSPKWDMVGGELTLHVGWQASDRLVAGLVGSGFMAGAHDLGFSLGGRSTFAVTPGFAPGVSARWREVGLDLRTDGARVAINAFEVQGRLEFRHKSLVVGGDMGIHFGVNNPALVWGLQTGARFK